MSLSSLPIIKADESQLVELRDLCITTFAETYEHLNTPENFRKYIEVNFNINQFIKELGNKNSLTFIATVGNSAAGYIKLNTNDAQTEPMGSDGLEIERIYVLKKYQGHGFGKELLNFSIEQARRLNKEFVWLGVWEKNEKAISFYERNSFKKFDTHIFILGDDAQTDYLYKRKL